MTVLIPAYEPSEAMLTLIRQLQESSPFRIVVVDDGSGQSCRALFDRAEAMGCTILRHEANQGKGRALKTGFRWIAVHGEKQGVVCADCDGQHSCGDIRRVASAVTGNPHKVVIGSRRFTGHVPLRSRFGNAVTRLVFASATGFRIQDTQSGLRGYSTAMLPWLCGVEGERFDYEIRVLLGAKGAGFSLMELPIQTIYAQHHSSHFRTITDSAIVYWPIIKFSASSLTAAGLDFVLLFVFKALTNNLLVSVATARIISAAFNYLCNRHLVFRPVKDSRIYAIKYFTLAGCILLCNYGLISLFTAVAGLPLVVAKLITESLLYGVSYWFQRNVVFRTPARKA